MVEYGTGKLEVYTLVESLGAEVGYDIGSSYGKLDCNSDFNLEVYPLI